MKRPAILQNKACPIGNMAMMRKMFKIEADNMNTKFNETGSASEATAE
jgi:hypothetical protein